MVSPGYTVLMADVKVATPRVVHIQMAEGPRKGETVALPRTVFEDPDLVDVDDDEVVIADWMVQKEGLAAGA